MPIRSTSTYLKSVPRQVKVFNYAGSWTWVKPQGCVAIRVQVVGGGGGAAGYCESGGAGGYAEEWIDVRGIKTVPITVGGFGGSIRYYGAGGDGGTTSFGSYLSATGGYGANRNHQHSGGRSGVGQGGQLNLYGGGGTGHVNPNSRGAAGVGGASYFGSGAGDKRSNSNYGVNYSNQAAPGTGGAGSESRVQWQGFRGTWGAVVIHEYFTDHNPSYRHNIMLELDATNPASYPGSGTVWYDISGNNNHFNIVANAFNSTNKYMDFNGSYGVAKNQSGSDIHLQGEVVYFCVTRIRGSGTNWRTLTRSWSADHHVILQDATWLMGMYDNNSGVFLSTGVSGSPYFNTNTSDFSVHAWRWTITTSTPDNTSQQLHYTWFVNGVVKGTINNGNAIYDRGFGSLGGYWSSGTDPAVGDQYWGDIKYFSVHAENMSDADIQEVSAELQAKYC